jgi:hypothetical protein
MDLACSSKLSSSIRYLFTSSIGSAQGWDVRSKGAYPEEVVMDAKYAVGGGYGESKYATERVCFAVPRLKIDTNTWIDPCKEWLASNVFQDRPGYWWCP